MYYIFAAFLSGALVGWLISIGRIRLLRQQIELYQYFVQNRLDGQTRAELGLEMSAAPYPSE